MMSKLLNALASFILILVILISFALFAPRLLGYNIYGVLSGSMLPTLKVGSVIYVKPCKASLIEVDDIITFKLAADSDVVATHRVIAIDDELNFTTKGDNNNEADGTPVSPSRLIGKVIFTIPFLGYFSQFIQTSSGLIFSVMILIVMIILWTLSDLLKKDKKNS